MCQQRQPLHDVRIRHERVRLVVEKAHDFDARADDEHIEPAFRERAREPPTDGVEMRRVEIGQSFVYSFCHSTTL